MALARSQVGRGAPPAWQTACCGGSATTPRFAAPASSTWRPLVRHWRSMTWMTSASTASTARCSRPSSSGSAADRLGSGRSRLRLVRSERRSKRSPSRTWFALASWLARPAAGSRRLRHGSIWGLGNPPQRQEVHPRCSIPPIQETSRPQMGDVLFLIVLIAPILGIWLLFIRPAQRRSQETAQLVAHLQVGQDVITTSGVYGTITGLDDESVLL